MPFVQRNDYGSVDAAYPNSQPGHAVVTTIQQIATAWTDPLIQIAWDKAVEFLSGSPIILASSPSVPHVKLARPTLPTGEKSFGLIICFVEKGTS
ncbi:hypothetical protein AB4037_21295 [Labrys sp. KB_33_2]|uniref:hypothetical protein n=1 Tax=Labrys sp. KB_33_2 TaxID=3237479 RepID=UPI003F8E579F